MATKKVVGPVKKNDEFEDALQSAKELLKQIKAKENWTAADQKKLDKLTKVVAILSKIIPLEKKRVKETPQFDSEDDKLIIQNFLKRKMK
jgi:phosphoribosyl-dephospho-CoA transferase